MPETVTDYIVELRETVDRAAAQLQAVSADSAARRPSPGKWSAKEIIGHLIDSAAHNHLRFLHAQWKDDLVFGTYPQERAVEVQRHQEAPWEALVGLWLAYNRHLARVMEAVPAAVRQREHRRHNLHEIAWQTVPAGTPTTLDYLMSDYVAHLQHHLRQIDALLGTSCAR